MRLLSATFVLMLAYAHRGGDLLHQPLSIFRDGEQRLIGGMLFLLLLAIGTILIRKLIRLRGYVGGFVVAVALTLLLIVAVTPSWGEIHHLCAFGLLGLVGFYYTMWLNLEKRHWLWPHLLLTTVIVWGAAFDSYGLWQKGFILYLVLLINVQFSFLRRIPENRGVQYTLYSGEYPPAVRRQVVYRLDREFFGKRKNKT